MKKRLMAALAAVLMVMSFAACGAEEEIPVCEFDLDAYGGMLSVTYADGSADETGAWGFCTEITGEGMCIGDVLAECDIAALEAVCEGDVFQGWLIFDMETVIDEFGFEEYSYVPAADAPISTDELLALPVSPERRLYAAKWESIPAGAYFSEAEEEAIVIAMSPATLFANGGSMRMHSAEEDYETTMSVATTEPGQVLGDALELDALLAVTRDGYTFAGWTVYAASGMESADARPDDEGLVCFEIFDGWYTILQDSAIIGEGLDTAEVGSLICGEGELFIAAAWE